MEAADHTNTMDYPNYVLQLLFEIPASTWQLNMSCTLVCIYNYYIYNVTINKWVTVHTQHDEEYGNIIAYTLVWFIMKGVDRWSLVSILSFLPDSHCPG